MSNSLGGFRKTVSARRPFPYRGPLAGWAARARVGRAALARVARHCGPSRAMWAKVENPVFLFFQRIEMLNYFCYESHFDKS